MISLGSLKRKQAGQRTCECGKVFNNFHIPKFCPKCQFLLGGSYEAPPIKEDHPDSVALNKEEGLVSVRLNKAGENLRVFVDLTENKCFSTGCLQIWATLTDEQKKSPYCHHLVDAQNAIKHRRFATEHLLKIEEMRQLINEESFEILRKSCVDGKLKIYSILANGDNLAVPLLQQKSHNCPVSYIHIRNMECPLPSCKARKSKLHTLGKKEPALCLHSVLAHKITQMTGNYQKSPERPKIPKIDRDLTIDFIMKKISIHFPTLSANKQKFLQSNRKFVETLSSGQIIDTEMKNQSLHKCPVCPLSLLTEWPFEAKKAYFISLGKLKEIKIPVKMCLQCRSLFYPQMYDKGLFSIHNKALLSVDFLLDVKNFLTSGSGLIDQISNRIVLMSECEGLSCDVKINLSNISKEIEKMSIAVLSLLITDMDMDSVLCLLCGCCPKIINSDGNTKDSIRITENLVFDFEDTSKPPDLQDFKNLLIKHVAKTAYFQNEPKLQINMLNLPIIMPKSLLGKQVNSDVDKKSLLDKTIVYDSVTFTKFTEMIDSGFDILSIDNLNAEDLKILGRKISLKNIGQKSGEMIRNELKNMSKHLLAGQGPCHKYIVKRGRTGGFTDVFCEHLFKIASKVQSLQESVSDPSDVVQSMKKMPKVHILDDSCNYVRYRIQKYPEQSAVAFGTLKGCFELPSTKKPSGSIDCPDILPLTMSTSRVNPGSMKNSDPLVHPDSNNKTRYCLGTRIQMDPKKNSHKSPTCLYHDANLSDQGRMLKTMSQEALQVCRKFRSIQQDRMRSFEIAFLANFILDFYQNEKRYQAQLATLMKKEGFVCITRDELTMRGTQGDLAVVDKISWLDKQSSDGNH